MDYQKLSVLWDALNGTDTILLKIQKAIVVKISTIKGKLPVSSLVFGPEDLARYGAAIDKLSSNDEESSRPRRTNNHRNRGAVSPDGRAANSDSWAPNEKMDASQYSTGKNLPPPLQARAHGRPSSSQHEQTNPESRSSPIDVHQRRREVSVTPVRHKRSRTARIQVSRAPIPNSEADIDEWSHDDSGESSGCGDIPSSERYNQKERVPLGSEWGSGSELGLGSELGSGSELESEGDSGRS